MEFSNLSVTYSLPGAPVPPPPPPPDLYTAPPGWEWTRPIGEAEVRAAERRAASTGETVLQALLSLYGSPVAPTGIAKILGVRQGPDVDIVGYTPGGTEILQPGKEFQSLLVEWEYYQPYQGYWLIEAVNILRYPDGAGLGYNGQNVWVSAPSPGKYQTQTRIYADSFLPVGRSPRIPPGTYIVTLALSRAYGGVTSEAVWDRHICTFEGLVTIE